MPGLVEQLRTYYEGLEPGQRRILVATVFMSLALLIGVGAFSWSDQHVEAYRSSNPADVQDVAAALEAQGVPFRISGDGRAIEVLPEDEGRARIAGASAGKVLGFEVLDGIELGTSPQREQWAYQRALQGELAQTISSLDEVEAARVHLVLPERSAFLRDERPPSASVTLWLLPGASLTKTQVRGITALVAGAVNGLKASEVVLVDHDGQLLAGGDEDEGPLAGMPTLLAMRTAEEKRTRQAIREALTRVLGSPEDVTVGVTVEVDTTAVDRLTRSQDPDSQVLISETVREENSQSTKPGGVPGTEANLPEEQAQEGQSTSRELLEQRSNYGYTEVEEREVQQPGSIKRVSVGVVVNSERIEALARNIVGTNDAGEVDEAAVDAKITELQEQVKETVQVAMGFDDGRKDSLAVTFLPFSVNDLDKPEVAEASLADTLKLYGPFGVVLLATVLFFFMLVRPLVSAVARAATPPEPLQLAGGDLGGAAGALTGDLSPEEAEQREASRNLTERLRAMVDNFENVDSADLNRLVDLEQEATAQVLRRWIRDS